MSLQWGVFRAMLDPVEGSEQAGTRPVLVVSRESLNQVLPVVAVLPLTSHKVGRRVYSTEVLLPAGVAGLPVASLVMGHQIRTVSKSRLDKHYGDLTEPHLREAVVAAVRLYLDMEI